MDKRIILCSFYPQPVGLVPTSVTCHEGRKATLYKCKQNHTSIVHWWTDESTHHLCYFFGEKKGILMRKTSPRMQFQQTTLWFLYTCRCHEVHEPDIKHTGKSVSVDSFLSFVGNTSRCQNHKAYVSGWKYILARIK